METIEQNGYSREEILNVLRGKYGVRSFDFRFELLNSSNVKISDLTNVVSGGEVTYDSLAEIKRKAKFTVIDGEATINYLNNRIKPFVQVALPKKIGSYNNVIDGIPSKIARWKLDETSGTVAADAFSFSRAGTIGAGITKNQTPILSSTQSVASMLFNNNTTSQVSATATWLNGLSEFTFVAWFLPTSSLLRGIASANSAGTYGLDIYHRPTSTLGTAKTNVIQVKLRVGSQTLVCESLNESVRIGQPNCIVFSWRAGIGPKLFVNGQESLESTITNPLISGVTNAMDSLLVGRGSVDTTTSWSGRIDDVSFYGIYVDGSIAYDLYQAGLQIGKYGLTNYAEWAQGVFVLSTPKRKTQMGGKVYRDIDANDLLQVVKNDKFIGRYFVGAGVAYTSALSEIFNGGGVGSWPSILGIPVGTADIVTSSAVTPSVLEWELGTSKLTIINDLLAAIGYGSLWFNENGRPQCRPYVLPGDRAVEYTYADDQLSVMLPEVEQEIDLFDTPNVWIHAVSTPDVPPLLAVYINNDPTSPTSTVSRGQTIVAEPVTEDEAVTQTILNLNVMAEAANALSTFEEIDFNTGIMPFHSDSDALTIQYGSMAINAKYIETSWKLPLKVGDIMTHSARRAIALTNTPQTTVPTS